jgi:hypothetical protein
MIIYECAIILTNEIIDRIARLSITNFNFIDQKILK